MNTQENINKKGIKHETTDFIYSGHVVLALDLSFVCFYNSEINHNIFTQQSAFNRGMIAVSTIMKW